MGAPLNGILAFPPAWPEQEQAGSLFTPAWSQTDLSASSSSSSGQAIFGTPWPEADASTTASSYAALGQSSWSQPEHSPPVPQCETPADLARSRLQSDASYDVDSVANTSEGMPGTRSNALTRRRRRQRAAKKPIEQESAAEDDQAEAVEMVEPSIVSTTANSRRWSDMVEEEDEVDKEAVCVDMSEAMDAAANQDFCSGMHAQEVAMWILSQLAADEMTRETFIWGVHQFALADQDSSRALQLALESASTKDAVALAYGLRGYVQELIASRHGNYVLQKVVEVVPASVFSFIAEELLYIGASVARHRFGCRILCRLLEHLNEQTCTLVDEVLKDAEALCRHHFGNYVIQHVLEFGTAEQKHKVACALRSSMPNNARNKNASRVIEKALAHCCEEDRVAMVDALLAERNGLPNLAEHQFGSFVVQAAMRLPKEQSSQVVALLRPCVTRLKGTRYGRRVADQLNAAIRAA